ncbi:hypothetical protein [Bacteroides ihuae]|uniref:hypothetical protein n=1 Tax=Bacteroides ihuae TaxID=1852362 RepID=UPI0008D92CAA|nr:hypothetical protein [Bacteroides ihuae]
MSKKNLYIFNPDNDLALANGDENYMPPASARQMTTDLALLPVWYAASSGDVLASSAYNLTFLTEMQELFSLSANLITEPEVAGKEHVQPVPWGWNAALRKRLLLLNVQEESMPTLEQLGRLTQLSHRSTAVELLPKIQLNEGFCGESAYLKTVDDVKVFVEDHQESILKAPLSGSGKGLNRCKGLFTPAISGWCARVAERQGGVAAEPLYEKAEDFAMEFFADGAGHVSFMGYSLFRTGSGGAYEGNDLLSNELIEERLTRYVPLSDLHQLRVSLEEELSQIVGADYSGYLGVDMMVCIFADQPRYRIHPCVEINLRMNMGLVARMFYDRYVQSEATGIFRIEYSATAGEALTKHQERTLKYPLRITQNRLSSGYLSLTPITGKTHYSAWVLVE